MDEEDSSSNALIAGSLDDASNTAIGVDQSTEAADDSQPEIRAIQDESQSNDSTNRNGEMADTAVTTDAGEAIGLADDNASPSNVGDHSAINESADDTSAVAVAEQAPEFSDAENSFGDDAATTNGSEGAEKDATEHHETPGADPSTGHGDAYEDADEDFDSL